MSRTANTKRSRQARDLFLRKLGLGLGLISALSLSACLSIEYGPMSADKIYIDGKGMVNKQVGIGYAERKDDQGRYILDVVWPQSGAGMTPFDVFDRRATELCGEDNYEKNIYKAQEPTVLYDSYGGRAGVPVLQGYVECIDPDKIPEQVAPEVDAEAQE